MHTLYQNIHFRVPLSFEVLELALATTLINYNFASDSAIYTKLCMIMFNSRKDLKGFWSQLLKNPATIIKFIQTDNNMEGSSEPRHRSSFVIFQIFRWE